MQHSECTFKYEQKLSKSPIPEVKTIKIETRKSPSAQVKKEFKQWEEYLTPKKSLQQNPCTIEQDFPSCKCQAEAQPPAPPKSTTVRPALTVPQVLMLHVHLQSQTFLALLQLRREPPEAWVKELLLIREHLAADSLEYKHNFEPLRTYSPKGWALEDTLMSKREVLKILQNVMTFA